MQPVDVSQDVVVLKLGVYGARNGAEHEREEELEAEERAGWHLALRERKEAEEREVRKERRPEKVALDELPLLRGDAERVDDSRERLGRDRFARVGPRRDVARRVGMAPERSVTFAKRTRPGVRARQPRGRPASSSDPKRPSEASTLSPRERTRREAPSSFPRGGNDQARRSLPRDQSVHRPR